MEDVRLVGAEDRQACTAAAGLHCPAGSGTGQGVPCAAGKSTPSSSHCLVVCLRIFVGELACLLPAMHASVLISPPPTVDLLSVSPHRSQRGPDALCLGYRELLRRWSEPTRGMPGRTWKLLCRRSGLDRGNPMSHWPLLRRRHPGERPDALP
eukprot:2295472-Rhodomonas_salina.1